MGGGRGAGAVRRAVGGWALPDDGEDGRGLRSFLAADADPAAVIERRHILAADTSGRRPGRGLSDGEVGAESRRSLPQVSTTPAQLREVPVEGGKVLRTVCHLVESEFGPYGLSRLFAWFPIQSDGSEIQSTQAPES